MLTYDVVYDVMIAQFVTSVASGMCNRSKEGGQVMTTLISALSKFAFDSLNNRLLADRTNIERLL